MPEVRGGVRQAVRERISAVVGRGEDGDRPPHPRTAALPGRPSAGSAPGRARGLADPLSDPATWHAVAAAVRLAGRGAAWPYAVLLGPETATVRLTGQVPDIVVERAVLAGTVPGTPRSDSVYVCLGSNGPDLVFLDLAQAPGVIAVDGDPRAATMFLSCLTAQLPEDGRPTIMLGTTNGSHWSLTVNADGVVSSLALGLTAASAGLPQQLVVREAPPAPAIAVPEPDPTPVFEPPPTLDGHPGLLPLPPRDAAVSIEPFAPSAHTPAMAGDPR